MDKKLQTKIQTNEIIKILEKEYPDAKCSLNYNNSLELTIALILAAQCTDNMVNKTIPILFNKYPDVYSLAQAKLTDIQKIVKPCGFYITKAKNILLTCNSIIDNYNGKVPDTMENLTKLYGIGRKSSNIILQECYNKIEGIAVDTHVSRLSKRIGITKSIVPLKQEQELVKKVDKYYFNKVNHIFVYHGRATCSAKNPKCDICIIKERCKKVI